MIRNDQIQIKNINNDDSMDLYAIYCVNSHFGSLQQRI